MADDSDDDDELVQVSHMVPESHRDQATENTEYGGISDAVREVYKILAEGGSKSRVRLEMQLRKVKRDRERIEEEITDLREQLDHLNDREASLEERVEEEESRRSEIDELLEDIEDMIREGDRVFPEHGKIQRAADVGAMTPEEVIDTLKERNPDIPERAFQERASTFDEWTGVE